MSSVEIHEEGFEVGQGREACLLIHGFTGSPRELRPLGRYLADNGYRVKGVRLAGHGTNVTDMMSTGWHDWRNSGLLALKELQMQHDVVHLIGLSMGGLMALDLGVETGQGRVIAMAAPYRLFNRWAWLSHILRFVIARVKITDTPPPFSNEMFSYDEFPVAGIHELLNYMMFVKRYRISALQRPTLILQGLKDQTVNRLSAWDWIQSVGSGVRKIEIFSRSGHILPLDVERERVDRAIVTFLMEEI